MSVKLEGAMIGSLMAGPSPKKRFIMRMQKEHGVTYQAVYKVLKPLFAQDILFEHGNILGLSVVYLEKQRALFEQATRAYEMSEQYEALVSFKPKQSVTFHFKTLRAFENAWTHIDLIIISHYGRLARAGEKVVFLSFAPHDWFRAFKVDSNTVWEEGTQRKNLHMVVITHPVEADKKEMRMRKRITPDLQYMLGANPLHHEKHEHLNVIGDFVIEASMDKTVAKQLEAELKKTKPDLALLDVLGKFKLKITRNKNKAEHLRKVAGKYFVFQQKVE